MGTRLTSDQVTQLAPDAASVAAGRKLANPSIWSEVGVSDDAVWGYAKGSGKQPYETAVALDGPAFKCSCPSRKIPCKHALGLLLLNADGGVPSAPVADWVAAWLTARAERAETAQVRAVARGESEADPEARARRQAKRARAIDAGLDDLDRFLDDLVQQGLAAAREQPVNVFETQAARLVDAQAPAMASRVRALGATLHAGGDTWPRRALEEAAMLRLAARGWRRRDLLSEDLRGSMRDLVGWPRTGDELRDQTAPLAGPWAVLGVRTIEEDALRVRRTWLQRLVDGRPALILDFAPSVGAFSAPLIVGAVVDGPLHPYPGRSGVRVVPGSELTITGDWAGPGPQATIEAAVEAWALAVSADPFVERVPVTLGAVHPVRASGGWLLAEVGGAALALSARAVRGAVTVDPWELVAVAGGAPIGIAAEFDGRALTPLAAVADGSVSNLQRVGARAGR